MHHNIQDKNWSAEERNQDTQRFVRQVRSATRRKHTAKEKAQVLETVEATPGSKGKVLLELGVFQERLLPLESQTKTGKP